AYVLGEQQQIQRCSDDGEPSGTAGRPILDVLLGEEIHNSVVIVTRYFGGTLLGTGGLVRAYGKAAQEGLANSQIIEKCPGKKYSLRTDYSEIGKIQYTLEQMELTALDTEYTETVKLYVIVPDGECAAFEKKITEATAGRAKLEMEKEVFFARMGGKIRLL
ncbi:MAG: YigZ family protein, partial [Acetivibrio sp.]